MKVLSSILVLVLMSIFVYGQSSWTKINSSISEDYKIEILESSTEGMIIKLNVNSYRFDEVETPNGTEIVVKSPSCPNIYKKGAPDLPFLTTAIAIPDKGGFKYEVLSSEFISINNLSIAPSKGTIYRNVDPKTVPYEYGMEYQINEFFPFENCEITEPYIIRDVRGSNLKFYPFVYNAINKELKIYTEIIVRIKFTDDSFINEISSTKNLRNDEFNTIYNSLFLNYSSSAKYTPVEEGAPGTILIISADEYAEAMNDYITWKHEKGIQTELVLMSEIGTTATQVKAYIQNYFDTENLSYVLLVGDADDVPTMSISGQDSDNGYAYLAGDDGYADVLIGRFSGNTIADIETQVVRTIYYEKEINTSDTWLANAFGSASNEGEGQGHDGGESDVTHLNNIRTDLENYGYTVTHVNQDGGSNALISTALNSGVGIINYIGHGDVTLWGNTSYTNTQVDGLTNDKKLPFAWSVACVNGDFNGNTCFAEAWLRATNGSNPTGAIAFLGSTINQSWAEPMTAQDEMNDILIDSYVNNIKRTMGGLSFNGMFQMIEEGGQGQSMADTWLIFGDPSLMVRSKTPEEMTISHQSTITVGQTEFSINCNVDNALVSLTKLSGEETIIMGYGYVSGGLATITLTPFDAPGTMKVTVTAFNKVTYQEEVLVIVPEGPYVISTGYTINDSEENNNGLADFSETIKINQSLQNVGVEIASGVNTTLTSENQNITITDNEAVFGDINADETITVNDAYTIEIADGIQDQEVIALNLAINDADENSWESNYNIIVNAPDFKLSFIQVDDTDSGNSNFTIDAGETVNLVVELLNNGHAISNGGNVIISTESEYVSISNNTVNFDAQDINSPVEIEFTVTINEEVPLGTALCFDFNLTAGLYDATTTTCLPTGQQMEDWESGTITSYDWVNESTYPWSLVSDEVYEGEYALQSGLVPTSGGESILTININVLADDNVEFYKKVNCQDQMWGYTINYLQFAIDETEMGLWYGQIDWTHESHPVLAGNRELKWLFNSIGYVSTGNECAWIDNIILPAHQSTVPVISSLIDVQENSIGIHPNPATDYINVNMNLTESTKAIIKVMSISGQIVFEYPEEINLYKGKNSIVLNTENYSNGLYIVQVYTSESVYSTNLVISK
ncbi:MAG: C25 family cysteine peptidase [Bacteroidales bacterium]|nr:C25 family cysteine peptidase [Bacteroidales bacterium]